jgi:hypothetical protein
VSVIDHVRLVSEAASIGQIRPSEPGSPRGKNFLEAGHAGKFLRADPEDGVEAARQVSLAYAQIRG